MTWFRSILPGLLLSSLVAVAAVAAAPVVAYVVPIPAMVIALLIGIALNPLAQRAMFQPGIVFCLKSLLRWAVALLGLRIALGEIAALGLPIAILVVAAMAATLVAGFALSRAFDQNPAYGALAGAGTAICGASATLATSIVLPPYKGKEADVAFVVVAVNALSTLAMLIYPLICKSLGFDGQVTGVMFGATIHDVAQVVGAGYAVSEEAGNTAVIVKLFRVLLLFPVVVIIGWMFARGTRRGRRRQDPDPGVRARLRPAVRAQQHRGRIPDDCTDIRAHQGAADHGLDLGPLDRDRGARPRHLGDRDRVAGLAPRRHRDRHHGGHPGSGDRGPGAAAMTRWPVACEQGSITSRGRDAGS